MTRIALIVTTYNRPDALERVLEATCAQTERDFEVLVADDGSTGETRAVVESFARRRPVPVRHVWHADRGFRAGAIRNRALAATQAEYVVFTDGDCIPVPGFLAAHRRLAEPGWFVSGNRVLLSEAFTSRVLAERLPVETWSAGDWFRAWRRGEANRMLPLLALPLPGFVRKRQAGRWEGARTCNLAAWRRDLLAVDGFDETYSGWGLEDSDLALRLIHAGIRHKSARFAAPVLHLWHRENPRDRLAENRRLFDAVIAERRTRALVGLSQLDAAEGASSKAA